MIPQRCACQARRRLGDEADGSPRRQRTFKLRQVFEIGPLNILHRQIIDVALLPRVIGRHHVGMRDLADRANFAQKPPDRVGRVQDLHPDQLQRHDAIQPLMPRQVNRAHPPRPQLPDHQKLAEPRRDADAGASAEGAARLASAHRGALTVAQAEIRSADVHPLGVLQARPHPSARILAWPNPFASGLQTLAQLSGPFDGHQTRADHLFDQVPGLIRHGRDFQPGIASRLKNPTLRPLPSIMPKGERQERDHPRKESQITVPAQRENANYGLLCFHARIF